MTPDQWLDEMTPMADKPIVSYYGSITSDYVSGDPKVLFDGETSAGTRTFKKLASYTPAANDRVALIPTNTGFFILGKVG